MSLRLSVDQALAKGLISKSDAVQMKSERKRGKAALEIRAAAAMPRKKTTSAVNSAGSPQKILFDDLCQRLPGLPQWEVQGLIPGRRFRADIFIPPNLVVEMDGFQYHRSKDAFQQDRMRQNLFVANGYRIIRVFAKQVFCPTMRKALIEQILTATSFSSASGSSGN